jgi:hypothetical protein
MQQDLNIQHDSYQYKEYDYTICLSSLDTATSNTQMPPHANFNDHLGWAWGRSGVVISTQPPPRLHGGSCTTQLGAHLSEPPPPKASALLLLCSSATQTGSSCHHLHSCTRLTCHANQTACKDLPATCAVAEDHQAAF